MLDKEKAILTNWPVPYVTDTFWPVTIVDEVETKGWLAPTQVLDEPL